MSSLSRRQFHQVTGGLAAAPFLSFAQARGFVPARCQVLVYGATPSGIAAAVSAARAGMMALLVEPSVHFGGMVTGGMSNTDFKTFQAVHGFYREFMRRIVAFYRQRYGGDSQQVEACYHGAWYEPSAATAVLNEILRENGVRYWLGQRLTRVAADGEPGARRIRALGLTSAADGIERETQADVFIDATYEGDLMAMAGCAYGVGRESRAEYGELFAGVKFFDGGKFLHGSTGEGDHRIQCYNFRLCMTDVPANRLPVPQPPGYQRDEYLPLFILLRDGAVTRVMKGIFGINRIPNGKADINDLMYSPFSLRLPGENYGWPDGDAAIRKRIFERHKSYTLGLWWFLQNDDEVPAAIGEEARQWGFPKDEFAETGHFPPILYVREGRRLKGDFVLTEKDTQRAPGSVRAPLYQDAVAVCDYSLDSHGNAPPGPLHPHITEGVFNWYVVPYQIPYRVMLPREVDNLLVPVAVSASHVAYSSLRMEPTWTALGQAAGLAAAQAIQAGQAVRKIDIPQLQHALHAANAITVYLSDIEPGSPFFRPAQHFGTRGLFHHLPEYKGASYAGRGESIKGQWLEAYPQHAVNPLQPVNEELAREWSKQAGLSEPLPANGMPRGEYLHALENQIRQG